MSKEISYKRFNKWGNKSLHLSLILILLFGLLEFKPVRASNSIYYVDRTNLSCTDTGSGISPILPFCTISKGASVALAGDTVRVLAGSYAETVTVPASGSPGMPITYSAQSGVVVTGNGSSYTGGAFRIISRSYIVIDGFSITGTADYGINISGSNHITISNNHVSHSGVPVSGSTRMGIYLSGTTASTITGNISDHNSGDGIRLIGSSSNNLVSNNIAFGNAEQYQRNATGIQLYGSSNNTVIHNITYSNEDTGIQCYSNASNNILVGNLSYGNGDHGIDNLNSPNNIMVGNTIQGNHTAGINVEGDTGSASSGATIMNNISVDNGIAPQTGQKTNIRVDASSISGTSMDYNLVYLSGPGDSLIQWNGITYATLAAFQAAVPSQEVHGIQADPLFVDPVAYATRPAYEHVILGDFHILAGSPVIDSANASAPSQPTLDIEGNPWVDDLSVVDSGAGSPTYVDRGAFEFQTANDNPTSTPQPVLSTPTITSTQTLVSTETLTPTATILTNIPSTMTFLPSADTCVRMSSPSTNYGTRTSLYVDSGNSTYETYIKFTISGLTGVVQSAKLRLYASNGSVDGPDVYATGTNWNETDLIWNNRPLLTSTGMDDKSAISSKSWEEFNVTPLVTGDGTYSFALIGSSLDGVTFTSRESGTSPELIVLTAELATSTPQPVSTPTVTALPTGTSTPTYTNSPTSTIVQTNTPIYTPTAIITITPTLESSNTPSSSPTPTNTNLPTPTTSPTNTSTATLTKTPTLVSTNTPSATSSPTYTNTPTATIFPTSTSTSTVTTTFTPSITTTATLTSTPTPTPPAEILLVHPFIGMTTIQSTVITWVTDQAGYAEVRYSLDQSYGNAVTANSTIYDGKYWYSANIIGLSPDTTYFYKVFNKGFDLTPYTEVTFTTPPVEGNGFTFAVVGDSSPPDNVSPLGQDALNVAAQIKLQELDLFIHTGDMVKDGSICNGIGNAWDQYISYVFGLYHESIVDTSFFTGIGNHEIHPALGDCGYKSYTDVFSLPQNAPNEDVEKYYSFDWGNAHFVVLNTEQSFSAGSTQYNWLVTDLQSSTKFWKFVFLHVPPYSSGPHGSDSRAEILQANLVPVFEAYGVDLVFSGHDHDYERTCPILNGACTTIENNGVVYTVNGGGGDGTSSLISGNWFSYFSKETYGFTKISVNGCTLQLYAIDSMGIVFDNYEINHCTASTPTPISTNTPGNTQTPSPSSTPTLTLAPSSTPSNPTATYTLTPTLSQSPTPTPTGSTYTFIATADSYVRQSSVNSNYGTNSQLWVDNEIGASYESYLKFSVSGVTGVVQSAILRIYSTSSTVDGPAVYATNPIWSETGITWATRPTLISGILDDKDAIVTGVWVEYNVLPAVAGDGTYSFALIPISTDSVSFSAREGSQPPQLVLKYGP